MKIIRLSTLREIQAHLKELNDVNYEDNLTCISSFKFRYLVKILEKDFFQLAFLQIPEIYKIVPLGHDRRIKAVASRVLEEIRLDNANFGQSWNAAEGYTRFIEQPKKGAYINLNRLVLRDTFHNEKSNGARYYLQDGNHRALYYAMSILNNKNIFHEQEVYLATNSTLKNRCHPLAVLSQ